MHTKYKHPEVEVDSLDKYTSALNIESVDLYVQQEASQQEEDRLPRQEKERAEKCRGRNKRKSYTTELKKQTLDLLDNLFWIKFMYVCTQILKAEMIRAEVTPFTSRSQDETASKHYNLV